MDLASLFQPDCRLCVLAGAGICVDPPSSLPTGLTFTTHLLSALLPAELHERIPALTDAETDGHFLRFEQLMLYVQSFDPSLHVLDTLGRRREPNLNHQVVAGLLAKGHAVFTTNFDSLIEHAWLRLGRSVDSLRPVIRRPEWERDGPPGTADVHKLHGSLLDLRDGSDCRDTIQATLRQVCRGKDQAVSLEAWKLRRLEAATQAGDLLVVGYSGLDDFDIVPALQRIASSRRLIWVDHDGSRPVAAAVVERVRQDEPSGNGKRLARVLRAIAGDGRREAEVYRVTVRTGEFLRWLADVLNLDARPESATPAIAPDPLPAMPHLPESRRWYLAAEIYSERDPQTTRELVEKAIELAHREGDPVHEAHCELLYGRQFEAMFQRIKRHANAERMQWWHAALDHYQIALSLIGGDEASQRKLRASALGNIGSMYLALDGDAARRKALHYFEQAGSNVDAAVDPDTSAWLNNQVGVAQHLQGNREQALVHYREAVRIDRETGDIEHLAVHLVNLGCCLCEHGDDDGLEALAEAVDVWRTSGSVGGVASALTHLGDALAARGRWADAYEKYELALTCVVDDEYPELRANIERSLRALSNKMAARSADPAQ